MVQQLGTNFLAAMNWGNHDLLRAEIGEEYESIEITITEEMVERNAWANDDYNPWYLEDSPFGGRIASPTILGSLSNRAIHAYFAPPPDGSFHAKQEYEFFNPLKIGKKITVTGKLVDRYSKRGRQWFVHEFLAVDEDGTKISRMRYIEATPVIVDGKG